MGWKVLVTARAFWASGKPARDALEAAGCEVVNSPEAGPVPKAELIPLLQGCQAVICSSDPYTADLYQACPDLKVVSRCGVGTDSVDIPAATEAGVLVTNTPGAMTDAVADYTFALMLGIARRLPESESLMRTGGWGEFPGVLIFGKTLGLVGFGQIGQGVAKRAIGFGMKILAYDPVMEDAITTLSALNGRELPVEFTSLEDLLSRSDFVTIHAPSTPETKGMFNAELLSKMKPTAYLINTARGALIDDAALIAALEKGTIAGAAIDVYQQEPLPADSPLRKAPRMLLTPHNAFNATEAAEVMSLMSAENVLAAMRGDRPPSLCNPEVLVEQNLRTQISKSVLKET